jgi:WD40 repeat protein
MASSPNGRYLVTVNAGADPMAVVWLLPDLSIRTVLQLPQHVGVVALADTGRRLAVVNIVSSTRCRLSVIKVPSPTNAISPLKASTLLVAPPLTVDAGITTLAFSPFDDRRLVTAGPDNIRLLRLKDKTLRHAALDLYSHHGTDLTFHAIAMAGADEDTLRAYVAGSKGRLLIVNVSTLRLARMLDTACKQNNLNCSCSKKQAKFSDFQGHSLQEDGSSYQPACPD